MALPSVGSGYQLGDGNINEIKTGVLGTPGAATVTATLTAAQLLSGLLVGNPGASAASYTLPTVALLEAALGTGTSKVNMTFVLDFINIGTASGAVTFLVGTGWTIVGNAVIAVAAGAKLTARKTAAGAWTLYIS